MTPYRPTFGSGEKQPIRLRGETGDVSGQFDPDAGVWVAPDGRADILPDVVAAIAAFSNSPGNATKMRVDMEPCVLGVKGKTTERLGFTGRGEGIAAQATATLRLPRSA